MIAEFNRNLLVFIEAFLMQLPNIFTKILSIEASARTVSIDPFGLINVASNELFKKVHISAK